MTAMTRTALQQLAYDTYEQFVRDTRDDGTTFWHRAAHPFENDWLNQLIYDAHGEFLPDDFRYECIVSSLSDIADADDPDEPYIEPPAYNATRVQWLGSDLRRGSYVDEVMSEYGDCDSIFQLLGLGMQAEMEEVYWSVLESLRSHLAEGDEDGEEDA